MFGFLTRDNSVTTLLVTMTRVSVAGSDDYANAYMFPGIIKGTGFPQRCVGGNQGTVNNGVTL